MRPVRTSSLMPCGRTSSSNDSSSSGWPDDLEDERVRPEVDDAGVEHVAERDQLGPPLGRRRDLDQEQLALDGVAGLELLRRAAR